MLEFVEGKDGEYKSVEVDFSDEDYENLKATIKDAWSKISNPEFWKEVMRS